MWRFKMSTMRQAFEKVVDQIETVEKSVNDYREVVKDWSMRDLTDCLDFQATESAVMEAAVRAEIEAELETAPIGKIVAYTRNSFFGDESGKLVRENLLNRFSRWDSMRLENWREPEEGEHQIVREAVAEATRIAIKREAELALKREAWQTRARIQAGREGRVGLRLASGEEARIVGYGAENARGLKTMTGRRGKSETPAERAKRKAKKAEADRELQAELRKNVKGGGQAKEETRRCKCGAKLSGKRPERCRCNKN